MNARVDELVDTGVLCRLLASTELTFSNSMIAGIIEGRGLTQAEAAQILEVDQPKVSALIRGRLAGFSLDRPAIPYAD